MLIIKTSSYEGSFPGWYDIVLEWESLGAVTPIRTHTRLQSAGRKTHKIWEEQQKKGSSQRSTTLKVRLLDISFGNSNWSAERIEPGGDTLCSLLQNLLGGATMHRTC